jgi:hypothetical protein
MEDGFYNRMSIFGGLFKKENPKPLNQLNAKDVNLSRDIFGNPKATLPVNFAQNVL